MCPTAVVLPLRQLIIKIKIEEGPHLIIVLLEDCASFNIQAKYEAVLCKNAIIRDVFSL